MGNKKKKGDNQSGNQQEPQQGGSSQQQRPQQQNPRPQQQNQPLGHPQQNPRSQQQAFPSQASGSGDQQQQGGSQQKDNKPFGWKCKLCNQNNFPQNVNCYNKACNAPKPTSSGGDQMRPQPVQYAPRQSQPRQQIQYASQQQSFQQHPATNAPWQSQPMIPQQPIGFAPQQQPFHQHPAPMIPQQPIQFTPQQQSFQQHPATNAPWQSQPMIPQQPIQFAPQQQPFHQLPAPNEPLQSQPLIPQQTVQQITQQPEPQSSSSKQPAQKAESQKVEKKDKKMAPGDWVCPNCQNTNFAKKNVCKCKTPRPAPVVEQPVLQASSSTSSVTSTDVTPSGEFEKLNISPTKYSKYASQFPIETSANPKIYEGSKGKVCKLEVNYGKISLNKNKMPKYAFHYDVTFEPDIPKKMLPFALDVYMRELFPQYIFCSDGRKNMYTAVKLKRDGNEVDGEGIMHEVLAVMGDRQRKFQVKVKYAGAKDLSILLNYNNPAYQNEDKPSEAIQVLDVVLRSALKNVRNAIPAGRQLYFAPDRLNDLGDGMELWLGLFQSAILGRSSIYLNVDVLHKAFPSSMPLLELLKMFDRDGRVPQSLDRYGMATLKDHLKMLTIGYRMNSNEPVKTYGFNDLIEPNNATFTNEKGQKMTVAQYFQQNRGRQLRFPNLPYLWVGSKVKRVYLPLEFCEIPAGQATNKKCTPKCTANIIKFSATSTDERKRKIRDLLKRIDYAKNPTISGFGIEVDTNFQMIDGRVIQPPNIGYKNSVVTPSKGVWREGKYLDTAREQIKWCIINCDDRTQSPALMDFKKNIMTAARLQNLILADMQAQEIRNMKCFPQSFKIDIENELGRCLQAGYRLVFVIVIDRNDCYARVKQAAELKVGILTQCIKAGTIFKMGRGNPQMTINNILLKVNSKLNGTNQLIQENSFNNFNTAASGVMFIGADVTHPSPDQRDMPSVVGVASSYDDIGFRYCCAWRLQLPTKEMIVDLENILVTHLQFYQAKNKRLPAKILYYRDGVSDGQFKEVLSIEMTAINAAMTRVFGTKEKAKVTFIVVQKRHHTRFFPVQKEFSDQTRFNNIVPGTVVDKNIIHPFQYQFFMASHAAIQGVTKPTKYCILINESKIAPDDIQAITYDLCHYFTRCNRAVSYPAPTYYAHLVAERGKNYIVGEIHNLDMNNLQRETTMRAIKPAIVNNSPMFFV